MPDYGVGSSSEEIKRAMRGDDAFLGVFTPSTLTIDPRGGKLIVNYSEAPGTHWVAMDFTRPDGVGVYYDSYGLKPDQADGILDTRTGFRRFMEKYSTGGKYVYNSMDLQDLDTAVCGDYAVYFLKHGLPARNNSAWAPILRQHTAYERDVMVRKLAGVVRSQDIGQGA